MSKNLKLVLDVARWEFNRWFKIKEQIITLAIGALISLLIFGGQSLLEKFSKKTIEIAIINQSNLQFQQDKETKFKLSEKSIAELDFLKKSVIDNEIDGVLLIPDIEHAEIIVNKEPVWLQNINDVLNSARQKVKLEQSNISEKQLREIFKPIDIELKFTSSQKLKTTTGEKVAVGIFIGLMLIGVFIGLGYQFVTITGEKQLRITEVIVSAISPQTWIDGKILGISFLSLLMLVTYSLTSIVFVLISSLFGSSWIIPISITNPVLIIELLLFSTLGFFFWNTFFAAIAATINDPNTSARGSLIMVPAIPVALAFFTLGNPDSLTMKVLSVFPLTSSPVISARLVLTEVSFTEIVSALLFLFLSIWYLRKVAGRIFAISILMYGKEPTWKEMYKWFEASKKQRMLSG